MLAKKTKYALHALTFLGKQEAQQPVLIADIAAHTKIPRKFLEAILLELRKAGILASQKGKGGGYYLQRPPEEIKLATIIRITSGPIAYLPCVSLNYYQPCAECPDEAACGLHKLMAELRDETLKILENKSIADIVNQEGYYRQLGD
jgi:Rrf2 family protein